MSGLLLIEPVQANDSSMAHLFQCPCMAMGSVKSVQANDLGRIGCVPVRLACVGYSKHAAT